jgi:hypothetical protein
MDEDIANSVVRHEQAMQPEPDPTIDEATSDV